jgi:ParB family chromosome partitioning protein
MSAMTKDLKPRGLGRGLAALLGDDAQLAPPPAGAPAAEDAARGAMTVPITWLKPGRLQPRTVFDPTRLAELAESIKAHGLVQPLLVRPLPNAPDQYEIVAGERRWRAAQQARLHEVPVVVRALDDRAVLEVALIENLQRADLGALEEARAYRRLMNEFGHTQEKVAGIVGKSRSHVANLVRLLDLPAEVRTQLERGLLEAGHARALIGTPDPVELASVIIADQMTVRQAEDLCAAAREAKQQGGWDGVGLPPGWRGGRRDRKRGAGSGGRGPAPAAAEASAAAKTAETRSLERSIEEALGLKVSIDVTGPQEQSRLTLWMESFDQMDEVVERLTRKR